MVLRTIEIKEISFKIKKEKQQNIKDKIKKLFGDEFKIISKGDKLSVRGDFRNYKKFDKIVYILSGGKLGENV